MLPGLQGKSFVSIDQENRPGYHWEPASSAKLSVSGIEGCLVRRGAIEALWSCEIRSSQATGKEAKEQKTIGK